MSALFSAQILRTSFVCIIIMVSKANFFFDQINKLLNALVWTLHSKRCAGDQFFKGASHFETSCTIEHSD